MRRFTIRERISGEERVIEALSVDSTIHNRSWSFSKYDKNDKIIMYCSFSQNYWDIVNNEEIET